MNGNYGRTNTNLADPRSQYAQPADYVSDRDAATHYGDPDAPKVHVALGHLRGSISEAENQANEFEKRLCSVLAPVPLEGAVPADPHHHYAESDLASQIRDLNDRMMRLTVSYQKLIDRLEV